MKKLMIAASAALCVTVGFSDVTSANIVGYQEIGVENGYTLTTPTFYAVGGGAVDIQTIIPTGANVPDGSSTDKIRFQLLDKDSRVKDQKTYYWRDFTHDYKGTLVTFKGWYEKMSASKTDVPATLTITPGDAFYMNCPVDDIALRFSGEVKIANAEIGLNNGYTLIGNPFPAEIAIGDLTPTGANVPDGSTTDKLRFQLLDKDSRVKDQKTYYWRDFTHDYKGTLVTFKGWYDKMSASKTDTPATLAIPAGCGLYVNSPVADVTMTVTSPVAQ